VFNLLLQIVNLLLLFERKLWFIFTIAILLREFILLVAPRMRGCGEPDDEEECFHGFCPSRFQRPVESGDSQVWMLADHVGVDSAQIEPDLSTPAFKLLRGRCLKDFAPRRELCDRYSGIAKQGRHIR
jgi:hypothetical protein